MLRKFLKNYLKLKEFVSWNADILRNSLISDFEIRAGFPVESTL